MVDKMMDGVRLELVQNRYSHSAIRDYGKESYAPLGTVAAAERYFVAGNNSGGLEHNLQFNYFACDVAIGERLSVEVGNGLEIPVDADSILKI